ncbi:hypothetical protein GmHk_U059798 [Glycine max]|nr:hypothetical protein GmHk_U059798 [Glycine max]
MAKVPLPLLLLHFVLSMNSVAMNSVLHQAPSFFKWHNASFAHSFVVFSPQCTVLLPRSSFVSLRSVWFGERLGSVKVKVKALRWSTVAYEMDEDQWMYEGIMPEEVDMDYENEEECGVNEPHVDCSDAFNTSQVIMFMTVSDLIK